MVYCAPPEPPGPALPHSVDMISSVLNENSVSLLETLSKFNAALYARAKI